MDQAKKSTFPMKNLIVHITMNIFLSILYYITYQSDTYYKDQLT